MPTTMSLEPTAPAPPPNPPDPVSSSEGDTPHSHHDRIPSEHEILFKLDPTSSSNPFDNPFQPVNPHDTFDLESEM